MTVAPRHYAKWLSCCLILSICFSITASAQSGRIIPKPTPTPQTASAKESNPVPEFVVDPSADRYKLIFTSGYEIRTMIVKNKEKPDYDGTRKSRLNKFTEELNRAGAQGYKLLSSFDGKVALVRMEKVQYEYSQIEISTSFFLDKGDFYSAYRRLEEEGFRFADHFNLYSHCDTGEYGIPENCEFDDLYLFERLKGSLVPGKHTFARSS